MNRISPSSLIPNLIPVFLFISMGWRVEREKERGTGNGIACFVSTESICHAIKSGTATTHATFVNVHLTFIFLFNSIFM
jgi:hypothetical protein